MNEAEDFPDNRINNDLNGAFASAQVLPSSSEEQRSRIEENQISKLRDYTSQPKIKRLISSIILKQGETNFKSVAILSELPREGRSFITSLVAFCYAQMYQKRVIIIDLSNPNKTNSWNFVNLISANDLNNIKEDNPNSYCIHLLVAKPQPDLINKNISTTTINESCTQLDLLKITLDSLKPSYDLILLDTNAMSDNKTDKPDSINSAKMADRSILVLSEKTLTREKLIQIKSRIVSAGIEVLGTIHNR
jgi:Mrp family chromosome partitioning ATPase